MNIELTKEEEERLIWCVAKFEQLHNDQAWTSIDISQMLYASHKALCQVIKPHLPVFKKNNEEYDDLDEKIKINEKVIKFYKDKGLERN